MTRLFTVLGLGLRLGIVGSVLSTGSAFAASPVYVHPTSPDCLGNGTAGVDCFSTLQDAINNAGGANPAFIQVLDGTYGNGDLSAMGSAIGGTPGSVVIEAFGGGMPSIEPATGLRGIENSISPFPGAITLRGLAVTSPDRDAIHLEGVTGDILLEGLMVTGAGVDGADLRSDGAVTILDSHFDGNANDGVEMTVVGPVLIQNSSANNNVGARELPNGTQLTADGFNIEIINGSLTILDSEANGNTGEGFEVHPTDGFSAPFGSISSVLIEGATAQDNGVRGGWNSDFDDWPNVVRGDGFQIESCRERSDASTPIGDPCTIGDVTIRDTIASNNSQDGIEISNQGAIILERLTVVSNGDFGTGDGIDIAGGWPDAVEGQFLIVNDNADDGILVSGRATSTVMDPAGWDVIFEDVTANGNGRGLPPYNNAGPNPDPGESWQGISGEEGIDTTADLENLVCRRCTVNGNGGNGAHLFARQSVVVEDFLADGNNENGAELGSDGDTDQLATTCRNCVSRNSGEDAFHFQGETILIDGCEASNTVQNDGIDITGSGETVRSLTIRNCITNGNTEQGIVVEGDNDGGPLAVLETLVIENVCAFDNKRGIEPKGGAATISLNNVQSFNNTEFGIRFDSTVGTNQVTNSNFFGNGSAAMVIVEENALVSAAGNWWGSPTGPRDLGDNPGGMGDEIWDASNGIGVGTIDFASPAAAPFAAASVACEQMLAASDDTVDFGSVALDSSGSMIITLTNPGTIPVVIDGVGPVSAPFSATEGGTCRVPPFGLAPGGSCTLEFAVAPSRVGPLMDTAVIATNSVSGPSMIALRAVGVEPTGIPVVGRGGLLSLVVLLMVLGILAVDKVRIGGRAQ